jgi:hypothetical protein
MMSTDVVTRREIQESLSRFRGGRTGPALALAAFDLAAYLVLWILILLPGDWQVRFRYR